MGEHGIVHARSQALIDHAYSVAKEAHGTQVRKYTGEPYITHPVSVARRVSERTVDCDMICAALLHDVLEDTDVTEQDLHVGGFGFRCIEMVVGLTEFSVKEDGNRAVRKALDKRYLARQSAMTQTVKVADLIDNTSSIVQYAPGFAKTYMAEKRALLQVLTKADHGLLLEARVIVDDYFRSTE